MRVRERRSLLGTVYLVTENAGQQRHGPNFSVAEKLAGHSLAILKRTDYTAEILMRPRSGAIMTDVTHILSAIEQGDPHATEQLLPLVHDQLRRRAAERMAQEKPEQTLQATTPMHEAYSGDAVFFCSRLSIWAASRRY